MAAPTIYVVPPILGRQEEKGGGGRSHQYFTRCWNSFNPELALVPFHVPDIVQIQIGPRGKPELLRVLSMSSPWGGPSRIRPFKALSSESNGDRRLQVLSGLVENGHSLSCEIVRNHLGSPTVTQPSLQAVNGNLLVECTFAA